jgi:glycosyltransferase involved in cell wall biosynthesis
VDLLWGVATKRRILVFAHAPPPHHGQSVMVELLVDALRSDPRFEVHHVDVRISDGIADIGSIRLRKFIRLLKSILQAWLIRLCYGRMAFYYVPAPVKKSAIMRDWIVMSLCRPLFPQLILHWHAYGLGNWASSENGLAGKLTKLLLGKADLSIVLNNHNKRDAEVFAPKHIEVVPNGTADMFPDYETALALKRRDRASVLKALGAIRGGKPQVAGEGLAKPETVQFLFLGHLMESKGVLVAIKATEMANKELRRTSAPWRVELLLAGSFVSEGEKARVEKAIEEANKSCRDEEPSVLLAGFLDSGQKKSALEKADGLVFPTFYENEAQPLVLFEAMSAGLPVVTTSWRGITEPLPRDYPLIVEPGSAASLAVALQNLAALASSECLRSRYEREYSVQLFARRIADILLNRVS